MINFSKLRLVCYIVLIAIGLLSGFMVGTSSAQQRLGTIVGTVVEEGTNNPLLGANVVIKGTRLGAATDANGEYRIVRVPAGTYEVEISFISYKTQTKGVTVLANQEVTVNFELEDDPLLLDEIVVIGYGTVRKTELTGSIVAITSEKLTQITTTTFQDVLQGTPGIQVTSRDGAPGAGINIRVRGIGSITAGSEPLYVIDGIPVTNSNIGGGTFSNGGRTSNPLSTLNPNDIESIVVLKDAASTAIYGSRGANGVVLITTKGGVTGGALWAAGPKFEFKIQSGVSDFAYDNILRGLNRDQYHNYFIEANVNDGMSAANAEKQYAKLFPEPANTNWLDEMTHTGITTSYDLSASGGTERFTYFVSASYFDQRGVVKENFFDRYSSRINLTAQLTDRFSIANNINIAYTGQRGIEDGSAWESPFYGSVFMPPTVPIFDEEGLYYGKHRTIMGANNPVGSLYDNKRNREQTRITNNLLGKYQLNDNISLQSAWGFDIYNGDDYIFENGRYGDGRNIGGQSTETREDNIDWIGTQTVNYTNTFSASHNVDAVIGYEAAKQLNDYVSVYGIGYAHPNLKTLSTAANVTSGSGSRSEFAFQSIFTRVNYDYNKKYYLSGSFRRDGSSKFGPDERWGNFWAVGLGYTLTEESFMQGITFIDYLKFRTSYGQIGNAAIGNYEWQGLYGFNASYVGQPGSRPSQVSNKKLTWESQGNFNMAFDYAVWNNKISGTIEYYKKNSSDLLLDVPISWTTGFNSILQNYGDMENSGIEFSVLAVIMRKRDFGLSVNFNVTSQKNEITKLKEPFLAGTKRREEGRDYQEYYLYPWAGVDPANGKPLYYTDATKTETTSKLKDTDRIYDGKSATPDLFGSFGLSGNWKRFTFNAQANYSFGNWLYEGAERFYHGDGRYLPRSTSSWAWENRWQKPGDIAKVPQQIWGGNSNSQPSNSSRWLSQGDYIRLKNVRVAYKLPETFANSIRFSSVEVYINLYNYYTWVTDATLHTDPEQTFSGVSNTGTPNSKTFSIGWNFGF